MSGTFNIFNASAGSGKTHQLVKEYLKVIFASARIDEYQKILAITFTNKATFEMKHRIVKALEQLTDPAKQSDIRQQLVQELGLDSSQVTQKANHVLRHIVHNYGRFSVQTIDQFTHGLVRSFSQDLMLPANFSLELDPKQILSKVIESLIEQLNPKDAISQILIDFIDRKISEGRSWNVLSMLSEVSRPILFEENDQPYYEQLKEVSDQDFRDFKQLLIHKKETIEAKKKQLVNEALNLIEENDLLQAGLNRYVPGVFKKFARTNHYHSIFSTKISQEFETIELCYKKATLPEKVISFQPKLVALYRSLKSLIIDFQPYLVELFLKDYNILQLLYHIQDRLNHYKMKHRLLPLIELNRIISEQIRDYDAPYIYEKLGERYHYFFIDEFQDTSKLQWENLIPLAQEAIDHASGRLLIVGDAKQAIYRWRGGVAEQFIDLYQKTVKPFQTNQQVVLMPKNYRSSPTIVHFCNDFFTQIGKLFQDPSYQKLYEDTCNQQPHQQQEGSVQITFSDLSGIRIQDEKQAILFEEIFQTITELQSKGYPLADLTILAYKNKELQHISDFLSSKGIGAASFELLRLEDSKSVHFLVHALTVLHNPQDRYARVQMLHFLNLSSVHAKALHHLYEQGLQANDLQYFFHQIYGFHTDWNILTELDVFQITSRLVEGFRLDTQDKFISGFLGTALEFIHQQQHNSLSDFLTYWATHDKTVKQNNSERDLNAVNLMTIHVAKGLEFPFVLVPLLDHNIGLVDSRKDTIWLPTSQQSGIQHIKIPLDKDLEITHPNLYKNIQSKRELDDVNTLYVALTRAEKGLYIFTEQPTEKDTASNKNKVSTLLKSFLEHKNLWQDQHANYRLGSIPPNTNKQNTLILEPESAESTNISKPTIRFKTRSKLEPNLGEIIHQLLSKIYTKNDVKTLLEDSRTRNYLLEHGIDFQFLQINLKGLLQIHSKFFQTEQQQVFNERDIMYNQSILRPDRVVITPSEQSVVIYDYKTSKPKPAYEAQLTSYVKAYESMGYTVQQSYLVYLQREELILQAI